MKLKGFAAFRNHRRAVAAVEFAIIAPALAFVLAATIDYGIMQWSRSCLVNAVEQGAYYAFLNGPTVSVANVQAVIQNASSLSGISVNKRTPPVVGCYCPTQTVPATLGPTVSCTTACWDTTKPGSYLTLTATYPLISLVSYSGLAGQTISETVIVRLQ
jgi:Flp pilus assembly protein TadG